MHNSTYRFTAFISYKRGEDDEKYAKWLQNKLEGFRIPTEVAPPEPADGQGARRFKVFRDKTDLGSHAELQQGLHNSLEQCRFLIVICSPRSAASPYVDAEVKWFQENGRADRVIPFIISGTPAPREGEEQCYPPALGPEALGVTLAEGSAEEALLKVVARLLRVDFHTLYQRHLRAQRRFMAKVAAGLALGLALVAGLAIWAVNAERLAKAQRREAESLVKFMTFDMRNEAFQYIPVTARETITQKVEEYYLRWGATSPEARYVRAMHLGNRMRTLFEKGENTRAEAMVGDILALLDPLRKQFPDDVELVRFEAIARFVRASATITRDWKENAVREDVERARALADELLQKRPDDSATIRAVAHMRENFARWLFLADDANSAITSAEAAFELRRTLKERLPDDAGIAKDYLDSLDNLCGTMALKGRTHAMCGEAREEYRRRSEKDPHNIDARFALAVSLSNEYAKLIAQSRFDAALPLHREGCAIMEDLVRRDPNNVQYRLLHILGRIMDIQLGVLDPQRDVAQSETALDALEAETNQLLGQDGVEGNMFHTRIREGLQGTRALLTMRHSMDDLITVRKNRLTDAEKRSAENPGEFQYAKDVAKEALHLAEALIAGKKTKESLAGATKALNTLAPLLAAHPENVELRKMELETLTTLSDIHRRLKDYTAARMMGTRALELAERLASSMRMDPGLMEAYGDALDSIGMVLSAIDDTQNARDLFQKTLDVRRELAKGGGDLERYAFIATLHNRAIIDVHLGNLREADSLGTEAVEASRRAMNDSSWMMKAMAPQLLISSLLYSADTHVCLGLFEQAEKELAEAATLARANASGINHEHVRELHLSILSDQGSLQLVLGRPANALPFFTEADALGDSTPEANAAILAKFFPDSRWDLLRVEALIALGRTKEARKALDAAPEHPDAPDTGQAPLLYRAKLAHLQSLLLTQEGEAAKAVHASDEALVLLESKTQRPETGILYSLPYLRLLAARAEALEADGRQAEAAAFWKKAATYGTECLKLAPEHARLQRATEKAEQNAARLRAVGGARQ